MTMKNKLENIVALTIIGLYFVGAGIKSCRTNERYNYQDQVVQIIDADKDGKASESEWKQVYDELGLPQNVKIGNTVILEHRLSTSDLKKYLDDRADKIDSAKKPYPSYTLQGNVESVKPGQIGYVTNGIVRSEGFVNCSAVIFDYKDSALMAHALPVTSRGEWLDEFGNNNSTVGNVVSSLIKEAGKRNIDYRACVALVNAGSDEALNLIAKDLDNAGILRGETTTEYAPTKENKITRTVNYNSKSDHLWI